jgi:hypothetical protein
MIEILVLEYAKAHELKPIQDTNSAYVKP